MTKTILKQRMSWSEKLYNKRNIICTKGAVDWEQSSSQSLVWHFIPSAETKCSSFLIHETPSAVSTWCVV